MTSCSRAANSVVHGRISPNFELIQALMYIIVICKYEMNPIKNVRESVMTPFFPTVTLSVAMETSARIWRIFELIQALICMSSLHANMKRTQLKIAEQM